MTNDKTRDRKVLERRRLRAASLFAAGISQYAVAKRLHVSTAATNQWHQAWQKDKKSGLISKGAPGFDSAYTREKRRKIKKIILSSPKEAGFDTDFWTIDRIRIVARRKLRVDLGVTQTWRTLHSLGFSCQKPERRSRERDERAIKEWKLRTFPRLKKMGQEA